MGKIQLVKWRHLSITWESYSEASSLSVGSYWERLWVCRSSAPFDLMPWTPTELTNGIRFLSLGNESKSECNCQAGDVHPGQPTKGLCCLKWDFRTQMYNCRPLALYYGPIKSTDIWACAPEVPSICTTLDTLSRKAHQDREGWITGVHGVQSCRSPCREPSGLGSFPLGPPLCPVDLKVRKSRKAFPTTLLLNTLSQRVFRENEWECDSGASWLNIDHTTKPTSVHFRQTLTNYIREVKVLSLVLLTVIDSQTVNFLCKVGKSQ